MTTESLEELRNLPETISTLTQTVSDISDQMLMNSLPRLIFTQGAFGPNYSLLKNISFRIRLYMEKSGEKVILRFWKKNLPTQIIMNFGLSFDIQPALIQKESFSPALKTIRYKVLLPFFVWTRPEPDNFSEFAPPGSDIDNALLLRLGENRDHILGIKFQEDGDGKEVDKIKFTPAGGSIIDFDNIEKWPVGPAQVFFKSILAWNKGSERDNEVAFNLPDVPKESTPIEVIYHIIDSYCQAVSKFENFRGKHENEDILKGLRTDYEIKNYSSKVILALAKNGEIAEGKDDDGEDKKKSFQLSMDLKIIEKKLYEEASISTSIPDFLVQGDMRQRFLDILINGMEGRIEELDGDEYTGGSEQELTELTDLQNALPFLRKYKNSALVFRVERKKNTDINLIVVTGKGVDKKRIAIFEGEFKVNTSKELAEITLDKDRDLILQDRIFQSPSVKLDKQVGRYFNRFLPILKTWVDSFFSA